MPLLRIIYCIVHQQLLLLLPCPATFYFSSFDNRFPTKGTSILRFQPPLDTRGMKTMTARQSSQNLSLLVRELTHLTLDLGMILRFPARHRHFEFERGTQFIRFHVRD